MRSQSCFSPSSFFQCTQQIPLQVYKSHSTNSDFQARTCLHSELNCYHKLLSRHISLLEKEDNVWGKWSSFQIHGILKQWNDHHGLSWWEILYSIMQTSHKIQLRDRKHKMEVEPKHKLKKESWLDLVVFGTFCKHEGRNWSKLKGFQGDIRQNLVYLSIVTHAWGKYYSFWYCSKESCITIILSCGESIYRCTLMNYLMKKTTKKSFQLSVWLEECKGKFFSCNH